MRGFAVSNIAWPFADRLEAYRLMAGHGITGIEIAPGMLFADADDAFDPPPNLIRQRLAEIEAAGLVPVSMQSLLFGVKDVALFGNAAQRQAYVAALSRAIRLAGALGIPHLVLGSPRERVVPDDMPPTEAASIATDIFARLGGLAQSCGCRLGLEPNPAIYGTNFATHTDVTAGIVRDVAHPGFCMTLDIGSLHINGELSDLPQIMNRDSDIIGHAHLSEPQLTLAPNDVGTAARIVSVLRESAYAGWLSIEMRASGPESCAALGVALTRLRDARMQVV
ncbi:sugar phosphate isomerase/epimerase family protein [Paracoccus laeviglucosivorans]|uniref:Sugar phosphate isomerase/epimerase n=1 Tax=Paracoccus laeviglucosivorans TaxID=1197861 RepID=A0A521E3R2_9RHOB|nr:TIM barrel protein [Paracoccus laeviglucosivorans]SMO78485.1 Sugar phosphate isomerase/epimerase [Paracoccus laeviglucosivorans]